MRTRSSYFDLRAFKTAVVTSQGSYASRRALALELLQELLKELRTKR